MAQQSAHFALYTINNTSVGISGDGIPGPDTVVSQNSLPDLINLLNQVPALGTKAWVNSGVFGAQCDGVNANVQYVPGVGTLLSVYQPWASELSSLLSVYVPETPVSSKPLDDAGVAALIPDTGTATGAAIAEAVDAAVNPGQPNGVATLDSSGLLPESQVPARLTDAELKSSFVTVGTQVPLVPQTMVVFGDSLTEQGGEIPPGDAYGVAWSAPGAPRSNPTTRAFSAWTWGNALLGQPFKILANYGIGGNTTQQVRARLQTVLDLTPGWVHLLCGTNNMGVAGAVAQAQTDITAMLDAFHGAGIRVVLGTIPPRITANYTGTQKADTLALNEWIRAIGRTSPGVIVVDYFAALADGSASNYLATLYGYNPTSDGTHLSATGGYACGKLFAAALRPYLTTVVPYSNPSPGANLLGNPRPGLALTGATAPTGFSFGGTAAGTATWSDTPRTDGLGTWKTVTVPSDGTFQMTTNATVDGSRVKVGDTVVAVCEYSVSGQQAAPAPGTGIQLSAKMWNGSAFTTQQDAFNNQSQPIDAHTGVIRTPPFVVPSGTTTVTWFLQLSGGQVFSFDRCGIYDSVTFDAS